MLFKILHGDKSRISTDITPYHEGYCYVTHDGYFYVDMNNERVKLNAKDAEKLTGYDIKTILNSSDIEIPTSKAIKTYIDNTVANASGNVELDTTLTKAGNAADSKAVGDALVEKADKSEGAFFVVGSGTTDSTNKTSTWAGTSDRITEYYDGLTIRYKIGVAGQTTTTLNINGLGAKTVYLFNTTKLSTQFPVNSIINLIYHADLNSGCWVCSDYDSNTNTYQRVYPTTTNTEYPITARYNTTTGSSYYAEYGRYSTGVTLNPYTNTITATKFKGALTGNADTATKATQDGGGNVITSTYETKTEGTTKITTHNADTSAHSDIREQINQLSSEINTPDYVIAEAESTISKVFSHGTLGRIIRFIAISDTHEDSAKTYNAQISESNKHAGQAIKYITDRIGIDFVAHLGDASSCGAWTTTYEPTALHDDIKNINKFVFSGVRGIKTAFIPGNHDMINMNGYSLLNSGAYSLFGNMCSGNKDRLGGWGYFDIDDANVRVMYLNTSDSPSSAAYLTLSQSQKNWLCEILMDVNTKGNADEWKVILLSHAPLDFGGANISEEILLPYVNGESYKSYNFSGKNNAKIISNIHGHVHCFSYGYIADKIRRFAIPNACFIGSNHYGSRTEYADWADTATYNKTANSGKDTSFSLITIDIDNGQCYVDNYGAGIDRVFSIDYKSDVEIIPTGMSNISYNGTTTIGETIENDKFNFTVTYSNGTSTVVTCATSVSPKTITTIGNNIVTITYTEGSVSITGTTTIVGTEAPIINLLNLDRTYMSGTAGENINNNLNESAAYLNVAYSNGVFNTSACTASNITENSVTVKESGLGGICVAYAVYVPDIGTQAYKLTFDYSGVGKCRVYCSYANNGTITAGGQLFANETAGATGSADATINTTNGGYTWVILYFSSNTGNIKTFTNVSLTKA